MRPIERAGHLAHLSSGAYRGRLRRARATIEAGLALCRQPFVAFSAGKDSSAMLWLVAEACPTVSALILTGGETRLLYPSLDSVLAWWRERWPRLDLREICVDHVFGEGWEEADWLTQYLTFVGEWDKYLHASGDWDGVFLGLRADESNKRLVALRRFRLPDTPWAIWRYSERRRGAAANHYRVCPLDAWTVADVAALMVQHEMPLLETYRHAGMEARTHMRTGRTALRAGQLVELRQRDRAAHNRLLQRFPELSRWS